MALQNITSFANVYTPSSPFTNVWAWAAGLGIDQQSGTGLVTYNVHQTSADWQAVPLGQVSIGLGSTLVPASGDTPAVTFPAMSDLMADDDFAAAFATIAGILDGYAKQHPLFVGATQTTP